MLKTNPFTSKIFSNVWCKHFLKKESKFSFDFISGLEFYKLNLWPVFVNVGKNLTKGVCYGLISNDNELTYKNKVFLIYDVPQYFSVDTKFDNKYIGVKKIEQYPGFLIHLEHYENTKDYLTKAFSKKSIQKLNRYNKRLEHCFDISSKMLIGNIEKSEYDFVFNHFNNLLVKRFNEKQITNNNLNSEEWSFYHEVVYPLILENKAGLHVIYNEKTPISVRLLYFSNTIIFDAITVFDTDYTKFHIGKTSILKMLEWGFDSDFKIFDFSKGYYDYKASWSDFSYIFEYHIYYDSKSIKASLISNVLAFKLKAKQYLRQKDFNRSLHKISFVINKKNKPTIIDVVEVNEQSIQFKSEDLAPIDILNEYGFLKQTLFDFTFLANENITNINTYKVLNQSKPYFLFRGSNKNKIIYINK